MAKVKILLPPKEAFNPNRGVSSLLRSQIEHLHEAERRLPHRYQSQIYINAIRTESEAASYIAKVTEAIHRAHADAAAERARMQRGPRGGISIAASAETPSTEAPKRENT